MQYSVLEKNMKLKRWLFVPGHLTPLAEVLSFYEKGGKCHMLAGWGQARSVVEGGKEAAAGPLAVSTLAQMEN